MDVMRREIEKNSKSEDVLKQVQSSKWQVPN